MRRRIRGNPGESDYGDSIDTGKKEGDPINDDFDSSYFQIIELRGDLKMLRWEFVSNENCCASRILTGTVVSEDLKTWDANG